MSDDFYRAFEEKHRGPRELILSRLTIYRPFISPLTTIYPSPPAVDLGCGRGEWLELLIGEGFSPLGIDQDEGMLQDCHEHNLPAQQGDAIAYLATLADDSQTIISAFHVVEHIPFDQLRTLVSEALRVLKPGGLLIMETPNPENIVVATRNFYLDPTHQRPLPPQLLSFLPEYYGFARTKILRIQESNEHATNASPTLNDVLAGASPDYAVVAQKSAPAETLELFDKAFNQEYGLSLNTLAERYDASIEARATQAEARATQAEARAAQAEARATQAEACANKLQNDLDAVHAANHHHWQLAKARERQIQAVYQSYSWRITAPLRWTASTLFGLSPGAMKAHATTLLRHAARYVIARPRLRNAALALLDRLPSVKSRLSFIPLGDAVPQFAAAYVPIDLAHLTPRARRIYADLKAAIKHRQKENR